MGKHICESIGIDWNCRYHHFQTNPHASNWGAKGCAGRSHGSLKSRLPDRHWKAGPSICRGLDDFFWHGSTANSSTKSCGKPGNLSVDAFTWTRNPCRFSKRSSPARLGRPCAMWHHMAPLRFQCLSWRFSGFPVHIFCEYLDFDANESCNWLLRTISCLSQLGLTLFHFNMFRCACRSYSNMLSGLGICRALHAWTLEALERCITTVWSNPQGKSMRFPAGWCQLSWTRHGFLVGGQGQGIVTHFPSQDDTEAAVKVAQEGSNPWRLQSSNTISCLEMFFPHWNCLLCLLLFVERIVY